MSTWARVNGKSPTASPVQQTNSMLVSNRPRRAYNDNSSEAKGSEITPPGTRSMPGARKRLGALPDRFRVSELGLPRLCRFRCVPVIFLITPTARVLITLLRVYYKY